MLIIDMDLYIKDYIYFCIYFQLTMSWILCDFVFGAHDRSQALEISRAPSFCRAEGAFLSVESPQVCLCIFLLLKRSIFIYKDYELFKH